MYWLNLYSVFPSSYSIFQAYPGGMGNYFIKITSKQLQMMLRGNYKVTQPPCFGSFALKRSFLGKLLLRPFSAETDSEWGDSETHKHHSPSQELRFCCVFGSLSAWLENMERGLEGLPKSLNPSAAAVGEDKRYIQAAARAVLEGFCLETSSSSAWNHPANLQGSLYLSHCKGNYFRFSSWAALAKGTLRNLHCLEKLIHSLTSLSFCFCSSSPCLVMIHSHRRKWKCSNCWLFSQGGIQFMEQKLQQEQKWAEL